MSDAFGTVSRWINDAIHGRPPSADDLSTLRARLGYANQALAVAEAIAEFRQPGSLTRIQGVRRAISALMHQLDNIQLLSDVESVCAAVVELQRLGALSSSNNHAAAARFGALFSALGTLSSHLPPPANTYADFLAASANFFTNVFAGIDPRTRHAHLPEGGAVDTRRPFQP